MPGGRPSKYSKKEQIQALFDEYVQDCIEKDKILTKAGLLVKLKMSRESYREYKAKKEFVDTIREIESKIEDAWVQALHHGKQATGPIFYLKNAFKEEYKDRTETDLTSKGEKITGINYVVPKDESHNNSDIKAT